LSKNDTYKEPQNEERSLENSKNLFFFNLVTFLITGRGFTKHYIYKYTKTKLINQVKYPELEYLLSQPRLHRYLTVCNNSKTRAKKLYKANLRLAQAFYPVLNLFEVILRNQIHYRLSAHFTNPNWITTEKNGFMNDVSLKKSRFYLKKQVLKAERKLKRYNRTITSGRIIAEQTLGFWTSLFEPHHFKLIKGAAIHCFVNKPAKANRKTIWRKLQRIRNFRNRVYHNEPICFKGRNIDFQQAEKVKGDIYELLLWLGNKAEEYINIYDNIDNKISVGQNL